MVSACPGVETTGQGGGGAVCSGVAALRGSPCALSPLLAGLTSFIFFRRPKGWLYWLAKQAVFLIAWVLGRLQRIDLHQVREPHPPAQQPAPRDDLVRATRAARSGIEF